MISEIVSTVITNINELYRYLDQYGLIRRPTSERAIRFIDGLVDELPRLNQNALKKLKKDYYQTIWGLQTGDIIEPLSIIPLVNGIPWPTVAADIIKKYPNGVGFKKKHKSRRKSKKKNKKNTIKNKN